MKKILYLVIILAILTSCKTNKTDKTNGVCCNKISQLNEKAQNTEIDSTDNFCSKKLQSQIAWARQYGDSGEDFGKSIGVDKNSNLYVGGWTNGTFGGKNLGGYDMLLVKLNSLGNIDWKKQFGTSNDEQVEEIVVSEKGIITLTGWTEGNLVKNNNGKRDIIVAHYDNLGEKKWVKQFGTDSIDCGIYIENDTDGNIYLTGYTAGNFAMKSLGKRDIFLIKLDSKGNTVFEKQFGTEHTDVGQGIHFDSEGNIYISGVTGGYWDEPKSKDLDIFLAKLDTEGNLLWSKIFGTPKPDLANPIKVDINGNLYIGGSTYGNYGGRQAGDGDAFIGKFDSNGNKIWVKQFGRDKWDGVFNIVFSKDSSGDILIAGCQNWNQCEGFCRRYNSEGDLIWVEEFAGDGDDRSTCGKDIVIDNQNNIYHTGGTNTSLFSKNKGNDLYVVKIREHTNW